MPLAKLACRLMLGERLAEMDARHPARARATCRSRRRCCRSAASRAPTPLLGPEMKSTGEVMGVAADYPAAFGKAQAAAGAELPASGTVFIAVTDGDKPAATQLAAAFHDMGFRVLATGGTAQAIRRMGVPVERIRKLSEGSPNVVERIEAGEVDLVINTPTGSGARADGWEIRRAAIAPRRALHHHDDRRERRPARDPRQPRGRAAGAVTAGAAPARRPARSAAEAR